MTYLDRDFFLIFRITINAVIVREAMEHTPATSTTTGVTHGEEGAWMMLILAVVVSVTRDPVDGKKTVLISRPKHGRVCRNAVCRLK